MENYIVILCMLYDRVILSFLNYFQVSNEDDYELVMNVLIDKVNLTKHKHKHTLI